MDNLNFGLEPPAVISGHVLDEDAEPVQGVNVQALRADFGRETAQYIPVGNAVTNDIGEFRLFGLPPGRFYLITTQMQAGVNGAPSREVYPSIFYPGASDFAAAAPITVAAGGEARNMDLHLVKTSSAALRGTVSNFPAGAERSLQVQIYREDRIGISFGNRFAGGFNANTGQYDFVGLTPGSYVLFGWIADPARFLYGRQQVEMGGTDLNDVPLTLGSGIEIAGAVRFIGGSPEKKGWRVALTTSRSYGPAPASTIAADGTFTLKNVTPDAWEVRVAPMPDSGYVKSVRLGEADGLGGPLNIASDTTGSLNIVIGMQGAELAGIVRSAGEKPATAESATVLIVPEVPYRRVTNYYKTAVSDADGSYRIQGIAPGKYRVFAFDDMEFQAYRDPEFVRKLEGRGQEINVAEGGKMVKDLTVEEGP